MNWKEFLSFTPKNLILALIVFVLIPVLPVFVRVIDDPSYIDFVSLLSLIIYAGWPYLLHPLFLILGLIPAYILSSIIIHFWSRTPVEFKLKVKEKLKPSKVKLIISILGWVSTVSIIMHYISGVYRGISNFPPFLTSLFNFFNLVGIVLFPFTILTFYVFFNATLILSILFFVLVTRLQANIFYGGVFHPSSLTIVGAIIVIPLIIVEWYVFSCLLVYLYKKFKG